nr:DUF3095 domain-containing protein [Jiella sp. LLJ827]
MSLFDNFPIERDFERLADPAVYHPLPDDWVIGLADIEGSTEAVERGQYKAVNTVAASVIAAVANALEGRDFPFVFAGDGAGFALPAALAEKGRAALAAVAGWAEETFGFHLRIAMTPVAAIRAHGHDVRVARFAASSDVSYTMFGGGGLAYAEARMKAGEFRIEPTAGEAARPDLTGLSCRFSAIPAANGVILSIIVLPRDNPPDARFFPLVTDILALIAGTESAGRPVPDTGPEQRWPTEGLMLEARTAAARSGRPLWLSVLSVAIRSLLAHLTFVTGRRVGTFEPARYRAELVRNTDFRKFDDGLMMTVDCSLEVADRIAARIEEAESEGIAYGGLHRQDAALMTCFVPTASRSDHVHFVDGAMGGYSAAAARALRERRGANHEAQSG